MINIKYFDTNLLSIDKISFKNTDAVIYKIKHITTESLDHEIIDSENLLYTIFNNLDGSITKDSSIEDNSTEESNANKYLIFASTNKNKNVLKKILRTLG